ncbi:mechanosensitive ion channel [Pontibaca sp. S1109L]|uniref:Mechanosensitive ion channel n=1 Tax=Pontibaca salina TaxID=2795731 RepID=A0A934HQ45_9RHOB|nr:mechanosensitive ion channel domain-containing protein [Pontibaca salina]MBI6628530.1 mechanosensitive ion channel [Pontibaca salina]
MLPALLLMALVCVFLPMSAQAQEEGQTSAWYEAETIATGPREGAEGINRRTPRETVRNFVRLTGAGDYDSAADFLNLSDLPRAEQAKRGPDLARQLGLVIERQLWLDWKNLSARPDAMLETSAANHPMAGQPRRDIGLKMVDLDGQVYEIRLGRYKSGDADPVWLFTPQTVENVPILYAAFGPRAFESYIPAPLKRHMGGLRIWEWIALPLLLGLLLALGFLINRGIRWLGGKAQRPILRQAAARARIPLALVTVAIAAQFLLKLGVSFSGPATNIIRPFLIIVIVSGLGVTALKIIDAVLDRVTMRVIGEIDDTRSLDERELYTSIYALRRIVVLVMVAVAITVILLRLNLFESLGMTLLASAGVVTVLLGIAGQAVLGNIMASLQIALAKPVRIGDSVLFEGHWAYVESIFYTFLRLRTWDERRIIVPVKYFVSQPFENWSVKDARVMKTITLFLDHRADVAVLRDVFLELAKQDEGVIDHESLAANVTEHMPHAQEVSFFAMSPDPSTGWTTAMRLREGLLDYVRTHHPDWWPRERVDAETQEVAALSAPHSRKATR